METVGSNVIINFSQAIRQTEYNAGKRRPRKPGRLKTSVPFQTEVSHLEITESSRWPQLSPS